MSKLNVRIGMVAAAIQGNDVIDVKISPVNDATANAAPADVTSVNLHTVHVLNPSGK